MTIYLLADRKLPAPADESAYPELKLYVVDGDSSPEVLSGIRKVAPAGFA